MNTWNPKHSHNQTLTQTKFEFPEADERTEVKNDMLINEKKAADWYDKSQSKMGHGKSLKIDKVVMDWLCYSLLCCFRASYDRRVCTSQQEALLVVSFLRMRKHQWCCHPWWLWPWLISRQLYFKMSQSLHLSPSRGHKLASGYGIFIHLASNLDLSKLDQSYCCVC